MSLRSVLLAGALSPGLVAQGLRLCERLETPLAYVAIDVGAAEGGAATLARWLAAPPLQRAIEGGGGALQFVRGVLERARGEVEVALLGVLPKSLTGGESLPLAVVRTQLSAADAERMRRVLDDATIATPARTVGGVVTYRLRTGEGGAAEGAGQQLEAAMVGNDLVVANNGRGLDEALVRRTEAAPRVLAKDARYLRLTAELHADPGALIAFADWPRLRARVSAGGGVLAALLGWSGLDGADAVAAAVAPTAGGAADQLQATLLLSFAAGAPRAGWFPMVEPAPVRSLVDELPVGGLGGVVLAVQPNRVVELAAEVAGSFCATVSGACGDHGIDFARLVKRLGQRGALQLFLLSGPTSSVTPAFALQAQNRKAAVDIVDEVARAFAEPGRAPDRNPGGVDLRDVAGLERLRLTAVDDLLVFAQEAGAITALAAARRERSRTRSQIDAAVTTALRSFGRDKGDRCGGLLHFDAADWLAAVGAGSTPRSGGAQGSDLPVRYTGMLDIEGGERRDLLRLRLVGTR